MKTRVCHVWGGPRPGRGARRAVALALRCRVWVCRGRPETGHQPQTHTRSCFQMWVTTHGHP